MEAESRKKILIVDNEPGLLLSIMADFEYDEKSFLLLTAFNGMNGMEVLERTHIDLIITDLRMSEMDGVEFVNLLQQHYALVPRFVMSAYLTPTLEEKLLNNGVLEVIDKPFDIQSLRATITHVLFPAGSRPGSVH